MKCQVSVSQIRWLDGESLDLPYCTFCVLDTLIMGCSFVMCENAQLSHITSPRRSTLMLPRSCWMGCKNEQTEPRRR